MRSAAAVFAAHDVVGLAEQAAALGVADLDDADADLGELGRADLARERAGVLGRGILRADDRARCPRTPRSPARSAGRSG